MLGLSTAATIYVILVTVIIGVCVGSFINCAAWRMVHGESVLRGRSHCATCDHQLSTRDLIPVFSYVALKGRCRYCGQRISPRYLIVELLTAAIFVSIVLVYGLSLSALKFLILAGILICLSLTDLDEQRIPNVLIVLGLMVNLVFVFIADFMGNPTVLSVALSLLYAIIDGLVIAVPLLLIALIMDKVLKRPSMGGGDIKLLFMVGTYFLWQMNLLLLIVACVVGIVFALVQQRRSKEHAAFPFGPSIAIATWVVMLFGNSMISWYVGLLV